MNDSFDKIIAEMKYEYFNAVQELIDYEVEEQEAIENIRVST